MNIVMPKLGLTMTEGILTRWLKAVGERVQPGDILFEFESEKSLMEYEAPAGGILTQILVGEGQTVPCNAPVAVFSTAAQPQPDNTPRQTIPAATPAAKRLARQLRVDLAAVIGRGPGGRIHRADVETAAAPPPSRAGTPLAKRLAADMGMDWANLSGSGPGGRVVKADVLAAARPAPAPAAAEPAPDQVFEAEPLAGLRAAIARRMAQSAFTAPHVTLFTDADATALVEARAHLNAEQAGPIKISYNAFFMAAAARALHEHPALNAALVDNQICRYRHINVALAVDTPAGLLAPVIAQANRLPLVALQQAINTLTGRAMAGQSLPPDLTGGTFTISNLGQFEIDGFTPIINPPQAAILGIGRIAPKPVVVNQNVTVRPMVTLSLSFDHRLADGAPAARFLQRIKQLVERPAVLLAHTGWGDGA